MIINGRQSINKKDISEVVKVLKSILTQGPMIEKFEKRLKNILNAKMLLQSRVVQQLLI